MMKYSVNNGRATSIPMGMIWGTGTSLLVTMLFCGIIAWMMVREILPTENLGYAVMILLSAASFAGAMVSYRKIKRRKLMVSFLSAAIYFLLLMLITALFFGGQYQAVGETALMILCGAMLFGISNLAGFRKQNRRILKK